MGRPRKTIVDKEQNIGNGTVFAIIPVCDDRTENIPHIVAYFNYKFNQTQYKLPSVFIQDSEDPEQAILRLCEENLKLNIKLNITPFASCTDKKIGHSHAFLVKLDSVPRYFLDNVKDVFIVEPKNILEVSNSTCYNTFLTQYINHLKH